MQWHRDQIIALSPDAAAAKAAQELTTLRKWVTLGAGETALWGECQGSGAKPYQVSIDLTGPAFKCSCPSRKFPCKHGIGLFLILAQQPGILTEKSPPPWTIEWLSKRVEKEEKKASKLAEPEKPVDPEGAAKAAAA